MPDAPFKTPHDAVNLPAARSPVETAAILALVSTPGASATQVAREVTRAGSARRVLEHDASGEQSRLFGDRGKITDLAPYVAQLDAWERDGIHVRTVLDADYPPNLLTVPDAPPLLYIAGAVAQATFVPWRSSAHVSQPRGRSPKPAAPPPL